MAVAPLRLSCLRCGSFLEVVQDVKTPMLNSIKKTKAKEA